jgi:hypothetical protein
LPSTGKFGIINPNDNRERVKVHAGDY